MNEETKGVYLLKTIQQDEEQFKEQGTVLGPSDPSDCTYANGYMKRQTVHICLTCKPTGTESLAQGGICTACALECHKDHQVTPIGTRRLFRCDCGNARFPTQPCKLTPLKDVLNDRNAYEGFCSVTDTDSLQCLM
ncbi:unnamed protein product [Orchesella dallaii]|uniref:UBR-type domain-containing protein n=1 Tax=Orchesella dallaii TaxID=48710 RepID=A0ABP1PSU6_9HEXA